MIRWNEEKDRWLVANRGISFQEIADMMLAGDYLDLLENPARPGQDIAVLVGDPRVHVGRSVPGGRG